MDIMELRENFICSLEQAHQLILELPQFSYGRKCKYDFHDISLDILNKIKEDYNDYYVAWTPNYDGITYAKSKADKFLEKKRIKTSLGRFIRRQFSIDSKYCSDHFISRLGDFLLSTVPIVDASRIKILYGDDVTKHFAETDSKSCMTGINKNELTFLYAKNPDKISLAVLDNTIRALLWKTDDGNTVFDRIYPSAHKSILPFRKWAGEQGYLLRDVADAVVQIHSTVGVQNKKLFVTISNLVRSYPYLDTFRFGNVENNKLILCNNNEFGCLEFTRANGHPFNLARCHKCNCICDHFKSHNFITYCDKCYYSLNIVKVCRYCGVSNMISNFVCKSCGAYL